MRPRMTAGASIVPSITPRSDHIGESPARPLEPPEAKPRDSETCRRINHQRGPIWRLTPDEDAPRVLDDERQWVHKEQNTIIFRQCVNRIKYRREKQQHRREDPDRLSDIAHVNADRG